MREQLKNTRPSSDCDLDQRYRRAADRLRPNSRYATSADPLRHPCLAVSGT